MKKRSLSIAFFLTTFFPPHLFSANLLVDYDEQKEGSYSTQRGNQVDQPKQVCDFTILNNKNVNHTLEDIEEVEEDLRDDVSAVNQRLVTTNNQSTPLLLGTVLQHKQTKKYHQYLITSTGLLSKPTQPNAVKRAHKKGFHLIKATRGHVSLQLLEWLQISKHYIVIALHTNRPVCRNCYLIANSLWEKELKTNEKGCIESQYSVLDKMPNLAQQYINTHLNFSLVQNLVVPMMGYVSKEEMNKAMQQKDKQIKEYTNELNNKNERIETLSNQLKDKDTKLDEKSQQLHEKNEQLTTTLKSTLKETSVKHQHELREKDQKIQERTNELSNKNERIESLNNQLNDKSQQLKEKEDQLEEKDEKINMLSNEVNKKDNQIKAKEQKIAQLKKLLEEEKTTKPFLDDFRTNGLFKAIENDNLNKVKMFLDTYKDVVTAERKNQVTPFLFAAEKGQLRIAKLLRQRGANVNEKDKFGKNALHFACASSGSVEMVKWLLDVCKIGIETKTTKKTSQGFLNFKINISGGTPFLFAAGGEQLAIAKLLKERGANIYAEDKDGKNALSYSKNNGYNEMRSYLKSLGLEKQPLGLTKYFSTFLTTKPTS